MSWCEGSAPSAEENLASQRLYLEGYVGLVEFGSLGPKDWRHGDESDHGVWVEPDTGVVRLVLCE